MDDERFRDLATEHLLSGLEGAELAELELELERRGAAGRAELARLREVLAGLALAVPDLRPPAELRERLLHKLGAGDAGEGFVAQDAAVRPMRPPWEWIVAAAAAAAVAFFLGVWNVELRERLRTGEAELARARAAARGADSIAALAETYRRDLDAVVRPQGKVLTLAGTEAQPGASARVFLDPTTGRALLFVYDLPVLQPGTVYQLWSIRGATPNAAGTFSIPPAGPARVELENAANLAGADALAVTVEPAPGGTRPTGKMVLRSQES